MRKQRWGEYPAQQADFHANYSQHRSIIVDKDSANTEATGAYDPDYFETDNPAGVTDNQARTFIKLALSKIRAKVGHSPMLVRARFALFTDGANTSESQLGAPLPWYASMFRILRLPDWADCNNRYRDKSASSAWGDDAAIYAPVPGLDHHPVPFASVTVPLQATFPSAYWYWEVTNEMRERLAAGDDLAFMMMRHPIGTLTGGAATRMVWNWKISAATYAFVELLFQLPVEYYAAKGDNTIDIMKPLDNSLDLDVGNLLLGSVERGETGSPVALFVKNLGGRLLPHLEVWDDSPEWSTPVADAGNTGSAVLSYVALAEASVSQQYTIKFTSPTAFQVLALAYKDNASDLNSTYGTTGWDGVIGSDWTGPSGGLTIPAAAWSGTPVANDKIYVSVTGQTTLGSWPADSNLQVEMAKDSGGNPDAASWRPIKGQRTYLTAGCTVDSTSKTLTIRRVTPALWPTGAKGFVADSANMDEFVVVSSTATSVDVTFPSATGHVYATAAKVCTTLPFRSLATSVWSKSTGAAGSTETNPALIPLTNASTLGFTAASKIVIQSVDDLAVYEEATVLSVDGTKITCVAVLTQAYPSGSLVMQAGSGEARFWMRIVALPSSMEELKRGRLAVRT